MAEQKWQWKDRTKFINEEALGYKRVALTGHAQDQMAIRSITVEDVLHVLKCPQKTGLPTQPKRNRYRWNKAGRTAIDVVWQEINGDLYVITTFKKTRKIRGR